MTTHRYIDIHVLQTVPPSNLNRDDAGSPKQAVYGGVRRARVSSQAWKRATRMAFGESTPELEQGTRTQRISALTTERLIARAGLAPEVAARVTAALLKPLKITDGKKEGNTAYLLFFGRGQIERIVDEVLDLDVALADLDDKALEEALAPIAVQSHLMQGHPIDVALFGRMVADLPSINVDASAQVAHALSTHGVETEFDYFTAVDDEKNTSRDDDAGAGMIGAVEFNSSTLYRYATVGLHQLTENLGGDEAAAAEAVGRFIDGFVRSMPTGKQNTFANRTLPDAVIVAVRDDQPINLVSAFELPVRLPRAAAASISQESLTLLARELSEIDAQWGASPALLVATHRAESGGEVEQILGESRPFARLVDAVTDVLRGSQERS